MQTNITKKALESLVKGNYDLMPSGANALANKKRCKEKDVLLVDVSGSMDSRDYYPSRIEAAKGACRAFADEKYIQCLEDEIALVSYSSAAQVECDFMRIYNPSNSLISAIKELHTKGTTNIQGGLECSYNLMFGRTSSPYETKHIILLSDGHDTVNKGRQDAIINTARKIKAKNCLIRCIGIGGDPSSVDEDLLKKIASVVNNEIQYWFITDADSLHKKYQEMAAGLVVYDPKTAIKNSGEI
jgi:Mg-chelatase subunit ChlD